LVSTIALLSRRLSGSAGVSYACKKKFGAFLDLPCGGQRQDAIRTKVFENFIRDHIDSWFTFAQDKHLDVERMEDIILVSGCTLVTSWAAAAFHDNTQDVKISLRSKALDNGGADFRWGPDINPGGVARHNSFIDTVSFLWLHRSYILRPSLVRMGIRLRINAYSSGASEQSALYSI
jgi:hypothetical protein